MPIIMIEEFTNKETKCLTDITFENASRQRLQVKLCTQNITILFSITENGCFLNEDI